LNEGLITPPDVDKSFGSYFVVDWCIGLLVTLQAYWGSPFAPPECCRAKDEIPIADRTISITHTTDPAHLADHPSRTGGAHHPHAGASPHATGMIAVQGRRGTGAGVSPHGARLSAALGRRPTGDKNPAAPSPSQRNHAFPPSPAGGAARSHPETGSLRTADGASRYATNGTAAVSTALDTALPVGAPVPGTGSMAAASATTPSVVALSIRVTSPTASVMAATAAAAAPPVRSGSPQPPPSSSPLTALSHTIGPDSPMLASDGPALITGTPSAHLREVTSPLNSSNPTASGATVPLLASLPSLPGSAHAF
jgi:hypothetical protein